MPRKSKSSVRRMPVRTRPLMKSPMKTLVHAMALAVVVAAAGEVSAVVAEEVVTVATDLPEVS
jgi:hypothetical protein